MPEFQIATPQSLIKRVREEEARLRGELNDGNGYSGPDPDAEGTARRRTRLHAMNDVMRWIEEVETERASQEIRRALKREPSNGAR